MSHASDDRSEVSSDVDVSSDENVACYGDYGAQVSLARDCGFVQLLPTDPPEARVVSDDAFVSCVLGVSGLNKTRLLQAKPVIGGEGVTMFVYAVTDDVAQKKGLPPNELADLAVDWTLPGQADQPRVRGVAAIGNEFSWRPSDSVWPQGLRDRLCKEPGLEPLYQAVGAAWKAWIAE